MCRSLLGPKAAEQAGQADMDDVPLLVDTSEEKRPEDLPAVPITIVTGYLGSGKSTLLQYLTQHNHGKKIAIILNEFGDSADIERSLTVSKDDQEVEEWLELNNGCLCCTVKDAGVTAIENLMKRRGRFDYILLETTGIADPAPIAGMFWLDAALAASVQLDGIVAVVDAGYIIQSLDEGVTAKVQIACADVVIINKCDTVDKATLQKALDRIKAINSACSFIETSYGKVDPDELLDLQAYSGQAKIPSTSAPAQHDTDITTVALPLQLKDESDIARVEAKLQHLLWENELDGRPLEIHRTKGKLIIPGSTKVLQGVRETYELISVPSESGDSKLVLIGRGLDSPQLQEYFSRDSI